MNHHPDRVVNAERALGLLLLPLLLSPCFRSPCLRKQNTLVLHANVSSRQNQWGRQCARHSMHKGAILMASWPYLWNVPSAHAAAAWPMVAVKTRVGATAILSLRLVCASRLTDSFQASVKHFELLNTKLSIRFDEITCADGLGRQVDVFRALTL